MVTKIIYKNYLESISIGFKRLGNLTKLPAKDRKELYNSISALDERIWSLVYYLEDKEK